jgi:hypothetical protein
VEEGGEFRHVARSTTDTSKVSEYGKSKLQRRAALLKAQLAALIAVRGASRRRPDPAAKLSAAPLMLSAAHPVAYQGSL